MNYKTRFIDADDGALQKVVMTMVPNLWEGQYVLTTDDKSKNYRQWRWCIDSIETIVDSETDIVLQNIYMNLCCPEDQWQEIMKKK